MTSAKGVNEVSQEVAKAALAAYDGLERKWQVAQASEWTIMAALVAVRDQKTATGASTLSASVISLATGSKCLGPRKMSPEGLVINDCHAEVLARRGLSWLILQEALARHSEHQVCDDDALLIEEELVENHGHSTYSHDINSEAHTESLNKKSLKFRPDMSIYLFVSELPCGDGSVVADRFSGAKLVADRELREGDQAIGQLRSKSGRSNLHPGDRSLSMSCSDKIARWRVVGLQTALLSSVIEGKVLLQGLVLSSDCLSSQNESASAETNEATGRVLALRSTIHTNEANAGQQINSESAEALDALEACWRATHERLLETAPDKSQEDPQVSEGNDSNLFGAQDWTVAICDLHFPRSRSSAEAYTREASEKSQLPASNSECNKRKKPQGPPPAAGLALQWIRAPSFLDVDSLTNARAAPLTLANGQKQSGLAQIIVQARGEAHGTKQSKKQKLIGKAKPQPRPLTCKHSIFDLYRQVQAKILSLQGIPSSDFLTNINQSHDGDAKESDLPFVEKYQSLKRGVASSSHEQSLTAFMQHGVFSSWRDLKSSNLEMKEHKNSHHENGCAC